jgi:hypothetical protein
MRRARRAVAWVLALGLLLLPGALVPAQDADRTPVQRFLGPVAELVASIEWVRCERARRRGREDLALLHAERALALAPSDTAGWDRLASHLGFDLASSTREPDPARRSQWLAAALAVCERGAERADDPRTLSILRGLLCAVHADLDPDIAWPGGARALWLEAARSFDRAASLGHASAAELAAGARARAGP